MKHRRVFRTRTFSRWMLKNGLTNAALLQAVDEVAQGLVDADLGGHVFKKRVALPGRGKRGSTRTIVATRLADRWFFIFGFNKNEKSNLDKGELKLLQELGQSLLDASDTALADAVLSGELLEVLYEH